MIFKKMNILDEKIEFAESNAQNTERVTTVQIIYFYLILNANMFGNNCAYTFPLLQIHRNSIFGSGSSLKVISFRRYHRSTYCGEPYTANYTV